MALVLEGTVNAFSTTSPDWFGQISENLYAVIYDSSSNETFIADITDGTISGAFYNNGDVPVQKPTVPLDNRYFSNKYLAGTGGSGATLKLTLLVFDLDSVGTLAQYFSANTFDDVISPVGTISELLTIEPFSPLTGRCLVSESAGGSSYKIWAVPYTVSGTTVTLGAATLVADTFDLSGDYTVPISGIGNYDGQSVVYWRRSVSSVITHAIDVVSDPATVGSFSLAVPGYVGSGVEPQSCWLGENMISGYQYDDNNSLWLANLQPTAVAGPLLDVSNYPPHGDETVYNSRHGSLGYRKGLFAWQFNPITEDDTYVAEFTADEDGVITVDQATRVSAGGAVVPYHIVGMKNGQSAVMLWRPRTLTSVRVSHFTGVSGWSDEPVSSPVLQFYSGLSNMTYRSDLPFTGINNPACLLVRYSGQVVIGGAEAGSGGELVVSGSSEDDYATWADITGAVDSPVNAIKEA